MERDKHWAEKIKKRDDEQSAAEQGTGQFHVQVASFIAATLPESWAGLQQCLITDVEKANHILPERRCAIRSQDRTSVWIQKLSAPFKGIRVTLDLPAQALRVARDADIDTLGNPSGTEREEISVGVKTETGAEGARQHLVFHYSGVNYRWPAELSEILLSFVYRE
jgi:hypothetical protein